MNELNVAAAVQQYLDENGFTVEEYTKPFVELDVGPFHFKMKNGPARQVAIPLHDMQHVATGYGTDLVGEAEVGMWELRGGCPNAFLVFINLTAVLMGALLSPARMWRAFKGARGAQSLYVCGKTREQLAAMTVSELRQLCRIPEAGVGSPAERRLHANAPKPAAQRG